MRLEDMIKVLEAERLGKLDYLVDSRDLIAVPELGENHGLSFRDTQKFLKISDTTTFNFMRTAHRQVADKLEIPEKYYERLLLHPEAWAFNVNWWLEKEPKHFLMRTFQDKDGTSGLVRALLSDRYRVIDHLDALFTALEELKKIEGIKIESCDLTEERMYLRVSHPGIRAEIKPGDEIRAGMVLANSETGIGKLYVKPRILRLICTNGMTTDLGVEQVHLGKKLSEEFLYSDDTQRLENELLFRKIKDMIRTIFAPETFQKLVDLLKESTTVPVREPEKAIKNIVTRYALSESHKEEILKGFIDGADSSKYGLIQAVTHTAHFEKDANEVARIEAIRGEILEMDESKFQELVAAKR